MFSSYLDRPASLSFHSYNHTRFKYAERTRNLEQRTECMGWQRSRFALSLFARPHSTRSWQSTQVLLLDFCLFGSRLSAFRGFSVSHIFMIHFTHRKICKLLTSCTSSLLWSHRFHGIWLFVNIVNDQNTLQKSCRSQL
jgi:hypothetical protein